jgi:hypothetical protein
MALPRGLETACYKLCSRGGAEKPHIWIFYCRDFVNFSLLGL